MFINETGIYKFSNIIDIYIFIFIYENTGHSTSIKHLFKLKYNYFKKST